MMQNEWIQFSAPVIIEKPACAIFTNMSSLYIKKILFLELSLTFPL